VGVTLVGLALAKLASHQAIGRADAAETITVAGLAVLTFARGAGLAPLARADAGGGRGLRTSRAVARTRRALLRHG
jgi:hypothetical protein